MMPMFEELGTAIEGFDIPVDAAALAAALALRDRLDARISDAVADCDRAGLWELDGAISMTAWLTHHTRMPRPRAAATTARARKLAQLPVTAAAWRDGTLSSGQVDAIAANLDADTVALFAEHEAVMVPSLVNLPVRDVTVAMAVWRDCATADRDAKPEPVQVLHLSRTLGGRWRLDANLGAGGGELLATALRLAQSPDTDGEPTRTAATRRADALADICRHFLDHQQTRRGGRHRPHLNLVLDLHRYQALAAAGASSVDGTGLDRTTLDRLLCDAALHRVLTQGRSTIIDYGRATRTIPAPLYNALVVRDRHCRFPGCDGPPTGAKATTSGRGPPAAPPTSPTSPYSAPATTTTSSTGPACTPNSAPTTPSRSPTPKAESTPATHPAPAGRRRYRSSELRAGDALGDEDELVAWAVRCVANLPEVEAGEPQRLGGLRPVAKPQRRVRHECCSVGLEGERVPKRDEWELYRSQLHPRIDSSDMGDDDAACRRCLGPVLPRGVDPDDLLPLSGEHGGERSGCRSRRGA
jgi:Domain of unknown function (DUF222)